MSWEKVPMNVFLKHRDLRFKPKDKRIIGLKRIEKIDFSGNIITSTKPSNTDMILVKKGDLVISGINVEKGAMAVYQGQEDLTATIHYSSYEFDNTKIDEDFLKAFLKSKKFTGAIKEQVPGGIKTEIKAKHLLPLVVQFPSDVDVQKKIVKALQKKNEKIEAIISQQSHQLNLLKRLRQQILHEAGQGRLVTQDPNDEPAGILLERIKAEKEKLICERKIKKEKSLPPIKPEEIPFEIPESWAWCRLGVLTIYSEAGKSFKCEEIPILDEEWGVIKVSAVSWDTFRENQNKFYSKVKPENVAFKIENGDFLISRANTSELVGKSVIVRNISKNLLLSDKTIRIKFSNSISCEYINLINNSRFARVYYAANGTGSSPSMKNITRDDMLSLIIPLPSLSEQHRIVAKTEQLMKLCDEMEQSIRLNQRYTQDLLQVALKEALEYK